MTDEYTAIRLSIWENEGGLVLRTEWNEAREQSAS